jgi:hypothetical protein
MTVVSKGASFAVKKESVALAALATRRPTNLTKLMGQAPQQSGAEATLKQQSNPGLPGVMVRDLSQGARRQGDDRGGRHPVGRADHGRPDP